MQTMSQAIGVSEAFLSYQEALSRVTDSERPVLILGERGTGKELAAQHVHFLSRRWEKPFITLLCPALSPTLLESELFGHEAGSFTGAQRRRAGCFERADKGTLFLDEVGDMPLPLQDKILRVIEYGVLDRVGGSASVQVDVRVVAATNRDLQAAVRRGDFRADLLDRLAFEVVHVPPLRYRGEDRELLARHFATKMLLDMDFGFEHNKNQGGVNFGPQALAQLNSYPWPGNVRELKNVIERSVLRQRSAFIAELSLDPFVSPWEQNWEKDTRNGPKEQAQTAKQNPEPGAEQAPSAPENGKKNQPAIPCHLPDLVAELEKNALAAALEKAKFRQADAARLLGLSYHQFRALYRKYALN